MLFRHSWCRYGVIPLKEKSFSLPLSFPPSLFLGVASGFHYSECRRACTNTIPDPRAALTFKLHNKTLSPLSFHQFTPYRGGSLTNAFISCTHGTTKTRWRKWQKRLRTKCQPFLMAKCCATESHFIQCVLKGLVPAYVGLSKWCKSCSGAKWVEHGENVRSNWQQGNKLKRTCSTDFVFCPFLYIYIL